MLYCRGTSYWFVSGCYIIKVIKVGNSIEKVHFAYRVIYFYIYSAFGRLFKKG